MLSIGNHSDNQMFHGEVDSADASGVGVAFTLYLGGSTTAYTLGSGEKLIITSAAFLNAAAGTYGIYADADAAGKRVMEAQLTATAGMDRTFPTGRMLPAGVTPKLIASTSGNVRGFIEGIIVRA